MRSSLILLGTILLLAGGFFVYVSLQTSTPPKRSSNSQPLPLVLPPTTQAGGGLVVGQGEDVWVKTFDDKTGQVAFQFRSTRYDPQPDGAVRVERPQAELFTGGENPQLIRIEGASGRVVMASEVAQRGQIRGRESGVPRRGELNDVTISLFDQSDLSRALLTCRVNNVAFDNDTFRIATEGYTDAGREVPADQVPVVVRGQDFDFDGRGLTIRWNETDRRLQLLEIAHGESLTIKSPRMLQAFDRAGGAAPRAAASVNPVRLVSADKKPGGAGKAARDTSAAARPPQVYRASFNRSVRVTQQEELIASADQMLVDFISAQDEPVSTNEVGDKKLAAATRGSARSESSPATRPVKPVVVRWTDTLRVTALEGDAPRPALGSMNIRMNGEESPVILDHRGMKLTCASFDYRSGDESLTVTSSPAVSMITLQVEDGTTVQTPSIVYTGDNSTATMRGAGRARIRAQSANHAEPETLVAEWQKSCELTLARRSKERLTINRTVLEGDVVVEHPRLVLRSSALELVFDDKSPDADQPALREIVAAGSVRCGIVDSRGARQEIRCDRLNAGVDRTPRGGMALRTVTADGNVVASGEDSELRAGHLALALVPSSGAGATTRAANRIFGGGDVELESLMAQQDVRLRTREGQSATADQLDVEQTRDGTIAKLLGQPAATLSDGAGTLSGAHIKIAYDAQKLNVHGPGTLDFDAREAPDQPARPVQMSWQSGLAIDGRSKQADVTGGVAIASDASDGSKQLATAERVVIALADAPASSTQPIPASARRQPGEGYDDVVRGKTLRSITLIGSAQVQSVLNGADDSQIRRVHLLAPELRYDLENRRAEVPCPGRMLVQDTRQAVAAQSNRLLSDFRGATAFQWEKELIFDQSADQMTMSGSVLIVHQDQYKTSQSFRLEAAQVIADLLPNAERPATRPAGASGGGVFGPSELKLRSLSADGDIRLTASQIELDAQSVTYDALRDLLTARGSDRVPVELYNDQGLSRGSFQEVVWNTKTEQIERMRQVQAQMRR